MVSTLLERTLSGSDSRLPPQTDEGARARTEAFVSSEFRRRRFEDEARVKMEALSLSILFAVAPWYDWGCDWGFRWGGMAEGGGDVGN